MVSDNFEDLVKCDYLEMKLPRKHRKLGRKVWKRKWFVLRRKSLQGTHRLEYFRSEEACLRTENKTIVSLHTLVKIEKESKSRTRRNAVKLIFPDTFIFLATDSDTDMSEWIRLIKKLVLPDPKPTPVFRVPPGAFLVTVINTEDSERMGLVGDFLLSISRQQVVLHRKDGAHGHDAAIARWELDDIPRFRLQKLNHLNDAEKIFIMNVGRTSQGAEGEYQFLTQDGREILETVKSHTKRQSPSHEDSPRSTPLGVATSASNSNSSFNLDVPRSRSSSHRSHTSHLSNSGQSGRGSRCSAADKVASSDQGFDAALLSTDKFSGEKDPACVECCSDRILLPATRAETDESVGNESSRLLSVARSEWE